ncbi:MAG: MerR family transcriptional regulator [bacterium]|nr:MerR family transcriptional regulator [bacterium]
MKTYSIGEVGKLLNLTSYTLRYYEKEGLLPNIQRSESGIRRFTEADLGFLRVINCLKATGMPIKDIKQFIDWCDQGDATLKDRYDMFLERKETVQRQINELEKVMDVIDYKCDYYRSALETSTKEHLKIKSE